MSERAKGKTEDRASAKASILELLASLEDSFQSNDDVRSTEAVLYAIASNVVVLVLSGKAKAPEPLGEVLHAGRVQFAQRLVVPGFQRRAEGDQAAMPLLQDLAQEEFFSRRIPGGARLREGAHEAARVQEPVLDVLQRLLAERVHDRHGLQGGRRRCRVADVGPCPLDAMQSALLLEPADGLADRGTADREQTAQIALRRQRRGGGPFAFLDSLGQAAIDGQRF